MTKIDVKSAYAAPEMKSVSICCEEGFAPSLTIDGLTPGDGAWDDESNAF